MELNKDIGEIYQQRKIDSVNKAIQNGKPYDTGTEKGFIYKGKKVATEIRIKPAKEKVGLYCGDAPPWEESL